jgi:hypothetical protein
MDEEPPPRRDCRRPTTEISVAEIAALRIAVGEVATRDFLRF